MLRVQWRFFITGLHRTIRTWFSPARTWKAHFSPLGVWPQNIRSIRCRSFVSLCNCKPRKRICSTAVGFGKVKAGVAFFTSRSAG